MAYPRITIAKWTIDLNSAEGRNIVRSGSSWTPLPRSATDPPAPAKARPP